MCVTLQIQMRDIPGFVETRYKLLQLKPNNRNHWISFAVGHHLEGNHELAAQIMTAYESTQEEIPSSEAYEHSELLLYKAQVLQEGGHATEALTLLQTEKVCLLCANMWCCVQCTASTHERCMFAVCSTHRPCIESRHGSYLL